MRHRLLALLLLLGAALPAADTRTRAELDLTGPWRFQPHLPGMQAPSGDWGTMTVPGNWMDRRHTPGQGTPWAGTELRKVQQAWYERQLTIPAAWAGRQVVLELDRVSTDATVSLDGRELGTIGWPSGVCDLTPALRPGTVQTLRLRVMAFSDKKELLVAMGANAGQNEVVRAEVTQAGLLQPARVVARPRAHVAAVAITPSVRRKELAVAATLAGIPAGREVTMTARLLTPEGHEERQFTSTAVVEATDGGELAATATWAWPDPRLWDLGRPELYTLDLTVQAPGFDDVVQEVFGFRECWVDGRNLLLNGTPIRLRPVLADLHDWKGKMEALGANFIEIWPGSTEERGRDAEPWYDFFPVADRAGVLTNGVLPDMGWMGTGVEHAPGKAAWAAAARRIIARYRNHPSIILWGTSGNMLGTEIDPRLVGQRDASRRALFAREPEMRVHYDRAEWGIGQARALDDSRPIFIHNGGSVGDLYCPNWYPNWLPLQEREELLSTYATKGDMPLMVVEFGCPLYTSAHRGRNNYGNATVSEPLGTEYLAIYQGTEAYRQESAAYRAAILARFKHDQTYDGWHWDPTLRDSPGWQAMMQLFVGNTWRAWRTWGISGGMIPWDDANAFTMGKPRTITPAGTTLKAVNSDVLAWICGPDGTFTDKDHHAWAGEPVRKQVALINDGRLAQPFTASWSVEIAGTVIARGQREGTAEPATTSFIPIEATLPGTVTGLKAEGAILAEVRIGGQTLQDRFPLTAFARQPALTGTFPVVDPDGTATRLLRGLGAKVVPWESAKSSLVVIGRGALDAQGRLPQDLEAFIRRGGRALLLGQDPAKIPDATGVRIAHNAARRVYPIDAAHPLVAGLTADDLRDWNGASTLVEPYPTPVLEKGMGTPTHGWRWGNRGSVATAALEKPHYGGWRPLLEAEFDLAYTPLMELDLGKGRLTWCQLDLEDHAPVDPVADLLARRLLGHVAQAPLSPRLATAYLGGPLGREALDRLGIVLQPATAPWERAGLVVIGEDAPVADEALRSYLTKGGRVLVLAGASPQGRLGTTLARTEAFPGSLDVPAWPEARGLSASDLRRRTDGPAWLVSGGCTSGAGGLLGRLEVGKGVALVAQLAPEALEADTRTHLRLTRWRQTRALAQLLANLGAESRQALRIFAGNPPADPWAPLSLAMPWQARQTLPLPPGSEAHQDPGLTEAARAAIAAGPGNAGWQEVPFPTTLEAVYGNTDGEAVFRTHLTLPPTWVGKDLVLNLGLVDDFDTTFVNGTAIGSTGLETAGFWNAKRRYRIPANLVPADGQLTIAVRMFDRLGGGGIGGRPQDCVLEVVDHPSAAAGPALYHPDYRSDFALGDDPYRVYNW